CAARSSTGIAAWLEKCVGSLRAGGLSTEAEEKASDTASPGQPPGPKLLRASHGRHYTQKSRTCFCSWVDSSPSGSAFAGRQYAQRVWSRASTRRPGHVAL